MMNSKRRVPATILITEPETPPFFIRQFQGRNEAVSHGPHKHRFFELILIESGEGVHVVGGKSFTCRRGDIFVIQPGESHNPDGLNSTVHWIVGFEASFISRKTRP